MQPLTPRDVFDYVPACDRDAQEGERTVFRLRPPSVRDRFRLRDLVRQNPGSSELSGFGTYQMELVLAGVSDIQNFEGVAFEQRVVLGKRRRALSDATLELIPETVLTELFEQLQASIGMTDDEGKS